MAGLGVGGGTIHHSYGRRPRLFRDARIRIGTPDCGLERVEPANESPPACSESRPISACLLGSSVKTFALYHLPDESFLYLLHAIAESEPNARKIVESLEWRLYFMGPSDVEQALFRLHQFRRVHYEVAGSLAQLQLPCSSSIDFARRICA